MPKRGTVKPQTDPAGVSVRQRLHVLSQLAAVDRVSTEEQLAGWLEMPYQTLRKLGGRPIGRRTALKILGALERHGYRCSEEWIRYGTGPGPMRGSESSHRSQSQRPNVGFDMKEAAARIARGLESSLRKSEALISIDRPKELERQQALVWALKDLARQLKRMGYNMDDLFDLTDDLAREVGLPPHPPHKDDL